MSILLLKKQFTPRQIFAARQGAWLEPIIGNIWQENTGVTPVSAPGQMVGLLLDQSQGMVLGPELVTNGDNEAALSSNTAATRGTLSRSTERSQSGSASAKFVCDNGVGAHYATTVAFTVGYVYYIEAWVYLPSGQTTTQLSIVEAGALSISSGNNLTTDTNKWVKLYGTVRADNTTIGIAGNAANCNGDYWYFDNLSVRQILGNHAYQATDANRPTYQLDSNSLPLIRHDTTDVLTASLPAINVRRNLWSNTETISGTGVNILSDSALAPNGTITADKLIPLSDSRIYQGFTTTNNPYTFSIYAKAAGYNWVYLRITNNSATQLVAWFNISTGAKGTVNNGITAAISAVENGFFRCSISVASAYAGAQNVLMGVVDADNSIDTSTNGASGAYLWGFQFEQSASITAYQKVTNWTAEAYASSGSVYFATPQGMSCLHNQSMGTTYNLPALSTDVYAWCVTPERLNGAQEAQLERYFLRKAGIATPDYLLDENGNILTDELDIPLLAG